MKAERAADKETINDLELKIEQVMVKHRAILKGEDTTQMRIWTMSQRDGDGDGDGAQNIL